MARPRFPAPYAILQIVLRCISVGLCIATLACASYVTSRAGSGRGMVGAFIASIFTMMVDLSEISGLADPARHVRRCTESGLVYLEVLTMGICGVLPIMVLLSDPGLNGNRGCGSPSNHSGEACEAQARMRRELAPYVALSWILPVSLVGLHLVFAVLGCRDYRRRARPRAPSITLSIQESAPS